MPKRGSRIFDPRFEEWLFDRLLNMTKQEKNKLNDRELHLVSTKGLIRRFVRYAPIERIEILLTKIGLECTRFYYDPTQLQPELLMKAYRQFAQHGDALGNIEEMFKRKMFVLDSRAIAMSLSLCGMNSHSEAYALNMNYLAIGTDYLNFKKNLTREQYEAKDGQMILVKALRKIMTMDRVLKSRWGLQTIDLAILAVLFENHNNFVKVTVIRSELKLRFQPSAISVRLGKLRNALKYVDKLPKAEDVISYRITSLGILAYGEVLDYILDIHH